MNFFLIFSSHNIYIWLLLNWLYRCSHYWESSSPVTLSFSGAENNELCVVLSSVVFLSNITFVSICSYSFCKSCGEFLKTSYGENIFFLFFFGFDTLTWVILSLSFLMCFQVKEIILMCNGQKNFQVFKKHWKEYHPEVQQLMGRVRWS